MKRLSFLKSIAGVGASTLGLSALSSFMPDNSKQADTFPSHLTGGVPDFNKVRKDFPRAKEIYMDNASTHPTSIYTAYLHAHYCKRTSKGIDYFTQM